MPNLYPLQTQRKQYFMLVGHVLLGLSGMLGACQQPERSNHTDVIIQTNGISSPVDATIPIDIPVDVHGEPPQIDLMKTVNAGQPWKIVFVSQDGPKGHENIAEDDCPGIIWCFAWQTAHHMGHELGAHMELAYVQEDCNSEEQCVRQQIQLLNNLVERGDVDGLIIGPRDSNQLVPVVEKAIASNIAVIAIGTPINSKDVLTLITSNNFEGGKSVGQWVADRLQGQGNVVILEGPKYQKHALARRHGFIAGLQGTNITVLDTETALWTCETAQAVTADWLAKFSDIDAIIAASDHMAMGARIATRIANRQNILITGYDAMPMAKVAIANGFLDATVEQTPEINDNALAVQLMVRHLETEETFPNVVYLPNPTLLSQQNLEQLSLEPVPNFNTSSLTCNL